VGVGLLNHEDVMKVGKLVILPRYTCGFGVYGWVKLRRI
jgi:hypothetical protein